jgi:2-dehydropantoate 2-reductase
MKILVYGAGAVGGYLGGYLSKQGHEVTLVTRDVIANMINEGGLIITEQKHTEVTHPTAVGSIAQAFMEGAYYDLIIMSMKAYDIAPALDPLVAFCPEPPPIIAMQNGIGVEQPLIDQFGDEQMIAGALTIPIHKETSHHLMIEKEDGGLGLAALQPGYNIKGWRKLFRQAGINAVIEADYQAMRWSKAVLNIVANATSAILNRRPALIYRSELMFDLEIRMLREAFKVMQALKLKVIDLPGAPATRLAFGVRRMPKSLLRPVLAKIVATGRGSKMPSFQIDLMSGKGKSEVIFHNGAIADAGKELGIRTPVNAALTDILKRLTLEDLNWREFDGRPKRLMQEIKRYEAAKADTT